MRNFDILMRISHFLIAMNRAALARMPACSGARRADHAEPRVLDFPRTRAYPCYYYRVILY